MPLDPRIQALLEGPNLAHVAIVMPDGSPRVAAVWIGVEDGRALFVKREATVEASGLRADPRLAISVVSVENPYEEAHMRGRVVEFRGEPEARAWSQAIAPSYLGPQPHDPGPEPFVLLVVEIDHAAFHHFLDAVTYRRAGL
ncbi:MAG: pyridoxamine 5'-phosphate oxidase family protein [Actinobacteria bacterium]|nr:pyridoxamine 5'-phosphate oxidase family protein [Actinomycetota bacterium]